MQFLMGIFRRKPDSFDEWVARHEALAPALRELVQDMEVIDRYYEKYDRSTGSDVMAACNAVLRYLDKHGDVLWVRERVAVVLNCLEETSQTELSDIQKI